MTDKKFNAILAKNNIAREIAHYRNGNDLHINAILTALNDIEKYLGVANQPSVNNISEHNIKGDRTFSI